MKALFKFATEQGFLLAAHPLPTSIPQNSRFLRDAAAVAAIVKAALEMAQKQQYERWQADVSDQLDRILGMLDVILAELRALRVWTDERITEESRLVLHRRIVSLVEDVNRILGAVGNGHPSDAQLRDLQDDFRDLRVVISDLCQIDGFAHVTAVLSGCCALLPLFAITKRKGELKSWATGMLKYLRGAVDPNGEKSLEHARAWNVTQHSIEKGNSVGRLARYWTVAAGQARTGGGSPRGEGSGPEYEERFVVARARGNLDAQIVLDDKKTLSDSGMPPWYPDLDEHYKLGEGDKGAFYMLSSLNSHRERSLMFAGQASALQEYVTSVIEVIDLLTPLTA